MTWVVATPALLSQMRMAIAGSFRAEFVCEADHSPDMLPGLFGYVSFSPRPIPLKSA
ncbi:MAG: hypothetical protein JWL99_6807, partial [Streptomyces oryziradicis]|nr:hypothetical protein [Actinacidiphila oryziradicis]